MSTIESFGSPFFLLAAGTGLTFILYCIHCTVWLCFDCSRLLASSLDGPILFLSPSYFKYLVFTISSSSSRTIKFKMNSHITSNHPANHSCDLIFFLTIIIREWELVLVYYEVIYSVSTLSFVSGLPGLRTLSCFHLILSPRRRSSVLFRSWVVVSLKCRF